MITVNYGKAQDGFDLIKKGWYEVIVSAAEVKKSENGNEYINMRLTIRDDVDQEYKGRGVFHSLFFTAKTEGIVQGFLKAIQAPEGHTFTSVQEINDYIKGKPLKANVIQKKKYNSDEMTNAVSSVKETEYPLTGGQIDPFNSDTNSIDIIEDDLPF